MDQPTSFQGRPMRAIHCMNQLHQRCHPACGSSPRNTRERAVGTAENGSPRDSSEAVPTAAKQDEFFRFVITQQFQQPAFKRLDKSYGVH